MPGHKGRHDDLRDKASTPFGCGQKGGNRSPVLPVPYGLVDFRRSGHSEIRLSSATIPHPAKADSAATRAFNRPPRVTPEQIRDSLRLLTRQIVLFGASDHSEARAAGAGQIWWRALRAAIPANRRFPSRIDGPGFKGTPCRSSINRWPDLRPKVQIYKPASSRDAEGVAQSPCSWKFSGGENSGGVRCAGVGAAFRICDLQHCNLADAAEAFPG